MTEKQLLAKFTDLTTPILVGGATERAVENVMQLERLPDLDELIESCCVATKRAQP